MIRPKLSLVSFLAGTASLIVGAVSLGAPTTAPAQTAAAIIPATPASYSSVLVLPFAPVAGASDWIGKGIQEDLATELVRQSRLDVLTPTDAQPAADAVDATRIARDKGASLVAFGTYQIQDTDVRINGQLIDTATGKPIAALKATGPRRDLFHMEDVLAAQAVASLPPTSIKVGGGAYASTSEAGAPAASGANYATQPYNSEGYYVTPAPDYTVNPGYGATTYTPTYDQGDAPYTSAYPYDYPYDYPWYGYGYPYWGGGFFVVGGFGGRHHDHGRDGGGRFFNGTESHELGRFNGVDARSTVAGEGSAMRSFSEGGFTRSAPAFHESVGSGGFHAASGFGGFREGGFGGGFHGGGGGGGGHR